jgi:beta-lactamase superfamily II metal-dependent hydrolase
MRQRNVPVLALALVAGCADDEGNPFDPASDTTPPSLLAVTVVASEDGTRAWVEWQADEPVRAVVEYGDSPSELWRHSYSRVREFSTSGRVRLLAAEAGRSYAYQVRMWDRALHESSLLLSSAPTLDLPAALADEPLMLLAMIDVGWGDAIYLEIPDADAPDGIANVLIDAGHPQDGIVVRRFLEDRGTFAFDFAGLTHIHEDHVGGFYGDVFQNLDGLIQNNGGGATRYPIGVFLDFLDKTTENGPYRNLDAALDAHPSLGAHVFLEWGATSASHPEALGWGNASVHLLAAGRKPYLIPDHALESNAGSVENNDSMVYRVQYGDFVAILSGDAEFATEQFIENHFSSQYVRADVLKLGHHGSYDANSERWIDFVEPLVGFVPNAVRENPGVEHPFVLNRLRNRGIDYYASDRVVPNRPRDLPGVRGDVLVHTDGNDYTVVVENVRFE